MRQYNEFLTIEYDFYNINKWGGAGMSTRKIELFSKESRKKDAKIWYPPNIVQIFNQIHDIPNLKNNFKTELGLSIQKKLTLNEQEKFKSSIEKQDKVMNIIKRRNEQFNYSGGSIILSTGSGKSILTCKIIEYFNKNSLILVNNIKLLDEMIDTFEQWFGITPGKYGGGTKQIFEVTVCTKSSFIRDFDIITSSIKYETVIFDEITGFSDKMRLGLNKSFSNINLFIMSGTLYTDDLTTEDIEKYFGAKIEVKDEYNYIPDFKIISYRGKEDKIYEEYSELRGLLAEDEIRFNYQIEELQKLYATRDTILVLTDRVLEADNFYNRLSKGNLSKFNLIKITGDTKVEDDNIAIQNSRLNNKKTIIIGGVKKVGIGFNMPEIDTVFLASAVKFSAQIIQNIGRSLRKADKKHPLIIIWNDHELKGQANEKIKVIKSEYNVNKSDIEFEKIDLHIKIKNKITLDFISII